VPCARLSPPQTTEHADPLFFALLDTTLTDDQFSNTPRNPLLLRVLAATPSTERRESRFILRPSVHVSDLLVRPVGAARSSRAPRDG